MGPNATPNMTPYNGNVNTNNTSAGFSGIADKTQKENNTKWIVAIAVVSVVAVLGVGFGIFQAVENGKRDEEISELKNEMEALKQQAQQSDNGGNLVDKNEGVNPDTGTSAQMYLEPEGWDVRFAYPEGVTDITYTTNDTSYDGVLYIDSITKNGKVYDVNICGGKDAYQQYPFFLGAVKRWSPNGQHESWNSSPANYDGEFLALTNGGLEYYVNSHYGNGCEAGDTTADYVEALQISKELLDSIEAK